MAHRAPFEHQFSGEAPDGSAATARMWIDVYGDMLALVAAVLDRGAGDVEKLTLKQAMFHRRLRYWQTELERLEGR